MLAAISRPSQTELAAASSAAAGAPAVEVPLPHGAPPLRVALGQEVAVDESSGRQFVVKWAQDEAGRLVAMGAVPVGAGGGVGSA